MIPLPELELKVGSSPSQLFEYNAVKTAFDNARQHRLYLFEDIEQKARPMIIKSQTLASLKAKDFRKRLNEDIQPCSTNFWKRQLNVRLDRKHWELEFNSTQETRLRVLQWKILHIYLTNILLCKMDIANTYEQMQRMRRKRN